VGGSSVLDVIPAYPGSVGLIVAFPAAPSFPERIRCLAILLLVPVTITPCGARSWMGRSSHKFLASKIKSSSIFVVTGTIYRPRFGLNPTDDTHARELDTIQARRPALTAKFIAGDIAGVLGSSLANTPVSSENSLDPNHICCCDLYPMPERAVPFFGDLACSLSSCAHVAREKQIVGPSTRWEWALALHGFTTPELLFGRGPHFRRR
jgi:hypothetical protein